MFGIDDAIIGAGVSLLGGLFGGDDEKTTSQINYKDMVKDAEEAGFNPLTAIRNGGSAGYVQTSHPALSSGAFISDALGKVGNLISNYDPMAKATADLEFKLKEETLRNLQADTAQRLKASIGGVPASAGSTVVRSPGGMAPALPASAGAAQTPKVNKPEVVNPWPADTGVVVDPNAPNADNFASRYGESEVAETAAGGYIAYRDWLVNRGPPGTKLPGFGDRIFTIPPLTFRSGVYRPNRPTSRNSAGKRLYQSPILPPN